MTQSSGERVFVSIYRFDTVRVALVKFVIPLMGIFLLVAFPWWCLKFLVAFDVELPPEARSRLYYLLGSVLLLGITTALMFFWLSLNLRRRFFDTSISYDDEGIRYRSGSREIACRWGEIREIKTREMGRTQTATVITPNGRFGFDGSMFEAHGPRPSLKTGLTGEKMVLHTGEEIPMKIRENELFRVIERKIAGAKKRDSS